MYYVYTLSYPEEMGGAVFYVGKGSGNRIFDHEKFVRYNARKRSGNHHKDAVIKRILDAGLEVRKEPIASFDLETDALAYESYLINTVYGLRNLTNMTTGGLGHAVEESPRLLGVPDEMAADDVAQYLNVHRKTVINLVERGELRGYRVGRNWRFRKSDVDEYLERQQEPKPDDRRHDDG
jgi:excisionase family DNA binding protein